MKHEQKCLLIRHYISQDVNLIQSTLGELGFEVESARLNLRQHELEFLISKIRETDFSKFNIFILFVLSHG